jgi:2-iminobutanoate/2-iminopropanoate deaminase
MPWGPFDILHAECEYRRVTSPPDIRALGSGKWDATYDSHFSDGYVANGFIFVSGQLPVDANGELVGDDVAEQARAVFENIRNILEQAGAGLQDIVQVNLFLLDVQDIPRIAGVRRELFGEHRPASTAVGTTGLLLPGAKLEINAVALRPDV